MRRKRLILVAVTCCLTVLWLTYRHFPKRTSGVPATVKIPLAGDVKPGYRVCLYVGEGYIPNPTIARDVLVISVNEKEQTITVDVTPAQAEKLARCKPSMLGGEDLFDPPWWWTRLMRLKGFSCS